MTKISLALAAALVLASAAPNVAFAATSQTRQDQTQDDRMLALAPAPYQSTYRQYPVIQDRAGTGNYADPWATNAPLGDGRPAGS